MRIVTQISAFPEERPDVNLIEKAPSPYISLRREMAKKIKKIGPYAFAKEAQEAAIKPDVYSQEKHALTSKEIYELADSVFQDHVNYVVDIEQFLINVRTITNYRIPTEKTK